MDQAIKNRWLTALRSGDYDQTSSVLNDGKGGFCCLGVLCEVAVEDGVVSSQPNTLGCVDYAQTPNDMERSVLPKSVKIWADVPAQNPCFNVNLEDIPEEFHETLVSEWFVEDNVVSGITLAGLNDMGIPFPVIADIIEKYV